MPSPLESPLFSLHRFAREMRKEPTVSEGLLWNALRDRRFRGIKFRRQHVLHPYIVDFFASSLKLVVEGFAGAGCITRGGYDYHNGNRMDGEVRDERAGKCMGAVLEFAARKEDVHGLIGVHQAGGDL